MRIDYFCSMKRYISILLLINTLFVFGQSKKEQITELQSQLKQSQLEESSSKVELSGLYQIVSQLKTEISSLEDGILILKKSNAKSEGEKELYASKLTKSEEEKELYASKLTKSEDELKIKKDSIILILMKLDSINSNKAVNKPNTASKTNDFLNNYVANRQPLNNNTFSFQLVKILTHAGGLDNNGRYISYKANYYGTGRGIPSIIDTDNFYLKYVPEGKYLNQVNESSFESSLVSKKAISFLNSHMPQIEVLKNKLVTVKLKNGREENLLFNLKSETNTVNEGLRITLATEDVNSQNDITWDICQINGEAYIALSFKQLKRLELPLRDDYIINYTYTTKNTKKKSYTYISNLPISSSTNAYFSEEMLYLIQKKNSFVEKDSFIDPSQCSFLFKLVE